MTLRVKNFKSIREFKDKWGGLRLRSPSNEHPYDHLYEILYDQSNAGYFETTKKNDTGMTKGSLLKIAFAKGILTDQQPKEKDTVKGIEEDLSGIKRVKKVKRGISNGSTSLLTMQQETSEKNGAEEEVKKKRLFNGKPQFILIDLLRHPEDEDKLRTVKGTFVDELKKAIKSDPENVKGQVLHVLM